MWTQSDDANVFTNDDSTDTIQKLKLTSNTDDHFSTLCVTFKDTQAKDDFANQSIDGFTITPHTGDDNQCDIEINYGIANPVKTTALLDHLIKLTPSVKQTTKQIEALVNQAAARHAAEHHRPGAAFSLGLPAGLPPALLPLILPALFPMLLAHTSSSINNGIDSDSDSDSDSDNAVSAQPRAIVFQFPLPTSSSASSTPSAAASQADTTKSNTAEPSDDPNAKSKHRDKRHKG